MESRQTSKETKDRYWGELALEVMHNEKAVGVEATAQWIDQGLQTPGLLDRLREGLGTGDTSLEEMVEELLRIRDTSDYGS